MRLASSIVFAVALYHLFSILQLTGGASYLQVFEMRQIEALLMLDLGKFNSTWLIGLVFFAVHLFLLGWLVLKSDFVPNLLGILLLVAGLGYLIDSSASFLMPGYDNYKDVFMMMVVIPGVIGELSFTVWLLLQGIRGR